MGNLDFGSIFTLTLFAATFRMATPILFATMGGIFYYVCLRAASRSLLIPMVAPFLKKTISFE